MKITVLIEAQMQTTNSKFIDLFTVPIKRQDLCWNPRWREALKMDWSYFLVIWTLASGFQSQSRGKLGPKSMIKIDLLKKEQTYIAALSSWLFKSFFSFQIVTINFSLSSAFSDLTSCHVFALPVWIDRHSSVSLMLKSPPNCDSKSFSGN